MKIIYYILLLSAIFFRPEKSASQITLEHVYDSASTSLYIIRLEVEGDKYLWRDLGYHRRLVLYNLDHSVFKIMPLPASVHFGMGPFGLLYVSEHLFNTDNLVEYMLAYTDSFTYMYSTKIIDEAGNIIFNADSLMPMVLANVPQTQVPIYNTSDGTKMILSGYFGGNAPKNAYVYSLGGTLTNTIQPRGYIPGEFPELEAFPNPSGETVTVEYQLPPGENTGELIFYDAQGKEVKRFQVDNTFSSLVINNTSLTAGTYYYQLVTSGRISGTKKMMVVR